MTNEGDGGAGGAPATLSSIAVKFTSSDKAAGRISISLESTIGAFKEAIRTQFSMQPKRLIFQGRFLSKDDQTLAQCKLQDGLTVVVQATPVGEPSSSAALPEVAAAAATPTAPAVDVRAPPAQAVAQALAGGVGGAGAGVGMNNGASPVGQAVMAIMGQGAGVARECLATLIKVIDNILTHPMEEKYRKIKRTNAGFRRKVGGVPGGEGCMRTLGFAEVDGDQGSWLLTPSAAAWDVLTAGRAHIQAALSRLPGTVGTPAAGSGARATGASASPGFAGGLGVLPPAGGYNSAGAGGFGGEGVGMGAGGMPDMGTIQRMMQNPGQLQAMMNDPSVQAMMRSNPQMAGAMQGLMANPGLMSQALNAMQSNPAMMDQAQRMMQNPAALERAAQMDLDGAFAAGVGAAGANFGGAGMTPPGAGGISPSAGLGGAGTLPTPPAVPNAAATSAAPSVPGNAAAPAAGGNGGTGQGGGGEEPEMTEDELLAEAIRRSMEDS